MGYGRAHNWAGRFAGFIHCWKCGLLRLKNAVSQRAIRAPCPGDE